MKRIKKIPVYFHHSIYEDVITSQDINRLALVGRKVSREIALILKAVGYIGFIVCYYVGLALIFIVRLPVYFLSRVLNQTGYVESKVDLLDFGPVQPGRWQRWLVISKFKLHKLSGQEFRLALVLFIVFIGLTVGVLKSAQLAGKAWDIKASLMNSAEFGLNDLTVGEQLLQNQSVDLAGKHFAEAISSFGQTQRQLNDVGGFMNGLLNALPQKRDANKLLDAVQSLSKAGLNLAKFYQHSKSLHLNSQGLGGGGGAEQIFSVMGYDLAEALKNVTAAQQNLAGVPASSLPQDRRLMFAQAKDQIAVAQTGLGTLSELIKVVSILSRGDKRILLLSENNNEQRATGGFIGTYGDIRLRSGTIGAMNIASIYALDGQLKSAITPPRPLWVVNSRWYMRDSNWFFDYPASVKKITSFYEKEGGETPDLVIAVTPTAIADLLKITGPIALPKYNVTLDSNNFVEVTQLETSVLYDKNANRPKQMLADFAPLLLEHLGRLASDQWLVVFETLQRDLAAKQILFYSRDPAVQAHFSSFNWSGEVRDSDRDYLAVVNTNLGGTKTDLSMEQKISLQSVINGDDSITNTLNITRTNPLPAKKDLENLDFLRVYVPVGATLISTQGFSSVPVPDHLGLGQETDSDILAWENATVKHVLSDTFISQEAGKTVFGNWLKVAGQDSKTVTVVYKLPFRLADLDHYSLLLQKQAGAVNQSFSYEIKFASRALAWKNFDAQVTGSSLALPDTEFNRDYFFGLVFDQPSRPK